jgi:hypothetical protein
MKYLYEIWVRIEEKNKKNKASIDKNGSCCIALCASSNKEALLLLQEVLLSCDNRPIGNKKKIKHFRLKDSCSKYIFLLCKENVESYKRACD